MENQSKLSLSLAVVCYHSTALELQRLTDSALEAIAVAKSRWLIEKLPFTFIDNSENADLSLNFLEQFKPKANSIGVDFQLIQGHGNIGYGRAHNLALKQLKSDFHLMLNPDVVLDTQSLSEGISYLLSHSDTAMVSPLATYENGDKQFLCKRYPSIFTLLIRGFFPAGFQSFFSKRLAFYEMHELGENKPSEPIPIASGCFMLCRTQPLLATWGFDESYFLYFEDFDLSMRLGKRGNIAYLPSMKIRHSGGHAAKKGLRHIGLFVRSGVRFFNTHGWRWFG